MGLLLPNETDINSEILDLRARLAQAEETLDAIRNGEVDALVVSGDGVERIYTLHGADLPYRVLVEQMQEGALTLSREGVILYSNLRFADMLQMSHSKLVASQIRKHVNKGSRDKFEVMIRDSSLKAVRGEIGFNALDGRVVPAFVAASPLPREVEGCVGMVITDLTEQESMRRKQAEIQALNDQLIMTMRETHHRVKNNLQIIASIVEMQIVEKGDAVSIEELRRVSMHARTLAAVHDLLTREVSDREDKHFISTRAILEALVQLVGRTADGRSFRTHIEDATLTSRQGTSLAIALSELVTNAIKHGHGTIEIRCMVTDGIVTCEVCDDGDGFPADFNVKQSAHLGLELVEQVTKWDLGGKVYYVNRGEGGACVRLCIPIGR